MKIIILRILESLGLRRSFLKVFFKLAASLKGLRVKFVENKILTTSKMGETIIISLNNLEYLVDVINYFDHYFAIVLPTNDFEFQNSKIYESIKNNKIVDYSKPREHTLTLTNISLMFSSFPESDEVTEIYVKWSKAKKGDVILDFGAFCGASAYTFSKLVGEEGIVYAFEPDPTNYECLLWNIRKHNLTNVVAIKKAIWSETTQLEFQAEGNMGSAVKGTSSRENRTVKVDAIALDDFINEYRLNRIDFIKMDIEGSEEEVIKSFKNTIKKFRTSLIIEIHKKAGGMTNVSVEKNLKEIDYHFECIPQVDLNLPLIYAKPN